MTQIERLVARHGAETMVEYVGEAWGNEPFAATLTELAAMLADAGPDYTDDGMSIIGGYDAGDAILIDDAGNAILRLGQ